MKIYVETMSNIPQSVDNSTLKKSFDLILMPILGQFYAKQPLQICNNFFEHGFVPHPF